MGNWLAGVRLAGYYTVKNLIRSILIPARADESAFHFGQLILFYRPLSTPSKICQTFFAIDAGRDVFNFGSLYLHKIFCN